MSPNALGIAHCFYPRDRHAHRGTTFAEVLVVMAMLGALVPVLSRAFQIGRQLESQSARDAEAVALAENRWALMRAGLLDATPVEDETLPDPWSDYRWSFRLESWRNDDAQLGVITVRYPWRGEMRSVALSGLLPTEATP